MRFAFPRIDSANSVSSRSRKYLAMSLAVGLVFANAHSFALGYQDATATLEAPESQSPTEASTPEGKKNSTPTPIPPPELEVESASPGQADFEDALKTRMNAESIDDLDRVVSLAESAIKKGMSPLNEESAKIFLASAYKQRVEQKMRTLMQAPRNRAAVSKMLGEFLGDLSRATELDPELVDAYLIRVAILRDRQEFDEAMNVVNQAIEIQEPKLEAKSKSLEFRDKLSKLYIARSTLQEDTNRQIEDLEKACLANPTDINVVKQLLATFETQQNVEGVENSERMIQVIDKALEFTTESSELQLAKIGLLVRSGKTDEAIEFCTKSINQSTDDESKSSFLRQRAILKQVQGDAESAKTDLDESIALAKGNVASMLLRARLSAELKQYEAAEKDISSILEVEENNLDAILLRGDIAAAENDFDTAIADYRQILGRIPNGNPVRESLLLKLSLVLWQSDRHSQAIRNLDQIVQANPSNWQAWRLKGEIFLGQGEHADAIDSYNRAISIMPEGEPAEVQASLFNNLSWVLATTPEDELRNGSRALELGLKACELTDYKQAHILSTLAAAYAETGDFDKAVEFSEKAVARGREENSEQLEQLEAELESFRDKKPWREKQEVSEAKRPNVPAPTGPET